MEKMMGESKKSKTKRIFTYAALTIMAIMIVFLFLGFMLFLILYILERNKGKDDMFTVKLVELKTLHVVKKEDSTCSTFEVDSSLVTTKNTCLTVKEGILWIPGFKSSHHGFMSKPAEFNDESNTNLEGLLIAYNPKKTNLKKFLNNMDSILGRTIEAPKKKPKEVPRKGVPSRTRVDPTENNVVNGVAYKWLCEGNCMFGGYETAIYFNAKYMWSSYFTCYNLVAHFCSEFNFAGSAWQHDITQVGSGGWNHGVKLIVVVLMFSLLL